MEEEGSLTVTKKQLASLWPYFTVISGTQDLIGAMGQSALATGGLAVRARSLGRARPCVLACRLRDLMSGAISLAHFTCHPALPTF